MDRLAALPLGEVCSQSRRANKYIDVERLPPGNFVAGLMKLSMMPTAEWNGEFIADFDAQSS